MYYRLLLLSGIAFLSVGCSSMKQFTKSGEGRYCLVDYKGKTINCSYENMTDCTKQYDNYDLAHCFRAKDLVNKLMKYERKN